MLTKDGTHEILDGSYDSSIEASNAGETCVDEGDADSYSVLNQQAKEWVETLL